MRRLYRLLLLAAVGTVAVLVFPAAAAAEHKTRPHTKNLHALGHSPNPATFLGAFSENRQVNSDIAFWGDRVFHGNYDGFRILRRSPGNPKAIGRARCNGDQGDIVVWGDILVRAWNSPAPADNPTTPNRTEGPRFCDGQPVPVGFEGVHVWDISDISNPELVGDVELSARPQADQPGCGSHTLTAVPDLAAGRLLIYNQTSGGNAALPPGMQECDWLDILQVPLNNPGAAGWLHREPIEGGHAAHDSGVILGDVNKLAVASGHMSNVFSIGAPNGGTPANPVPLFTIEEPGVCFVPSPPPPAPPLDPQRPCNGNWHSAGFSWDGEVIILAWEPGGGSWPECEASDPAVKKSAFFYDADTGRKLGQWTLPRPQIGLAEATRAAGAENCTIHNYNTIPTKSGRDILVVGNYQAGTWVTDFTDPSDPETLGWSDPPPLPQVQDPTSGAFINELGGAWSSYWYNGFIYESEITKGMNVFRFSGKKTKGVKLPHLNPQTQEFSMP